jgi:type 1 glutamine amidotransferase
MLLRFLPLALAFGLTAPAVGGEPPKKVLLVGSPPDGHPARTHEYAAGVGIIAKLLRPVVGVEVTVATAEGAWGNGPELIGQSDCVVLFLSEGARWVSADEKRLDAFRQLARRGGGLACLHWAMGTRDAGPIGPFVDLFGGCHGGPDRRYKVLEAAVKAADPKHLVSAGIADFTVRDEFYYRLKFAQTGGGIKPVLQVDIDGDRETVAWAWDRPDGGRSFGFSGLHFHDNWRRAEYRRLVAQGVLWVAKVPVPAQGLSVDLAEADYELPARK